jgi:hypothetical protein
MTNTMHDIAFFFFANLNKIKVHQGNYVVGHAEFQMQLIQTLPLHKYL